MGNMSYCRFQNTYQDLQDCADHIFDDDLSEEEQKARKWLIEICREIVADVGEEDDEDENL